MILSCGLASFRQLEDDGQGLCRGVREGRQKQNGRQAPAPRVWDDEGDDDQRLPAFARVSSRTLIQKVGRLEVTVFEKIEGSEVDRLVRLLLSLKLLSTQGSNVVTRRMAITVTKRSAKLRVTKLRLNFQTKYS